MISFNKPYISGNEISYLTIATESLKIASDGPFTNKCYEFFETKYQLKKTFLTTSCTDVLEMAAILLNVQ